MSGPTPMPIASITYRRMYPRIVRSSQSDSTQAEGSQSINRVYFVRVLIESDAEVVIQEQRC
jgi:hypothetical protein